MFNWFVLSLWEPLGIWRQNNVCVDSVSMCSVFIFILQIPLPVEMVGRETLSLQPRDLFPFLNMRWVYWLADS